MIPWRLIDTGPLDGSSNMAVDEALLRSFDPENSMPVFRIYGWEPPALSMGRFQKGGEILDRERCSGAGVAVVRRVTGGGVIYHADELTYSIVCAPRHAPAAASIKESFRVLTSFLLDFYERLGLTPRYAADHPDGPAHPCGSSPFCFAGRETYDILINGRKIGGNAQRRLKNVVFQHGSIPLVNRAVYGSTFLCEPPAGVGDSTTALRDLGVTESVEELRRILADSFARAMPADLQRGALTQGEEAATASLLREKHSTDSWIWEGKENSTGSQVTD